MASAGLRPNRGDATGIAPATTLGGDTTRFVDTGFCLRSNVQTFSPGDFS